MNKLYFGDNLDALRDHVAAESVDLIYLDPPFNSNTTYNQLYKEVDGTPAEAQVEIFQDTWTWGDAAERAYDDVMKLGGAPSTVMRALRSALKQTSLMAYLSMMAVRLVELHRALRPTGSLYLHCDPTASHYLKVLLDSVFGPTSFRTEISWRRQSAHNDAAQGRSQYGNVRDVILFYTKSTKWTWHWQFTPYDQSYVDKFYRHVEAGSGRRYQLSDITAPGGASPEKRNPRYEFLGVERYWRFSKQRMAELHADGRIVQTGPGKVPRQKRYLDEMPGVALQNDWDDIVPLHGASRERLGYPTQKPVALLERIVAASSNPGDVVLDPFCGCGTTIEAAENLDRRWIGIDIAHYGISLIEARLGASHPESKYAVEGRPTTIDGARELARRDKHQFQIWAAWRLGAQSYREIKKGPDKGIDGRIQFKNGVFGWGQIVISVKGGENVTVAAVRDLRGVIEREEAEMGVLVTLNTKTQPMVSEAVAAGFLKESAHGRLPRLQIVTAEEILSGRLPALPPLPLPVPVTHRRAAIKKPSAQLEMLLPFGEAIPKPQKGDIVDPRFLDLSA